MSDPRAFLLTWPTFGSRLHGDPRGTVDALHNAPGSPLLPNDPHRVARGAAGMRSPARLLSTVERNVVADTIRRHAAFRGWELIAVNVRTNHVHVVVGYHGLDPDAMVRQFKAYATRALRDGGHVVRDHDVWAEGSSKRWLWKDREVSEAERYVREGQDRLG